MIKFNPNKDLRQQLREQGLKFKDGVNMSFFEEMQRNINNLSLYEYAGETEYIRIINGFFKDLEKSVTKIEE